MIKNYVTVPARPAQDINQGLTRWLDGKCISLDEGTHVTVFIGHYIDSVDDDGNDIVKAFPIRVEKPVSRDNLINAAEMQSYGLTTSMDVASFNASLSRKSRENEDNEKVKEHDDLISWVKQGLTKIGI